MLILIATLRGLQKRNRESIKRQVDEYLKHTVKHEKKKLHKKGENGNYISVQGWNIQ